jgi:hypothetical protein
MKKVMACSIILSVVMVAGCANRYIGKRFSTMEISKIQEPLPSRMSCFGKGCMFHYTLSKDDTSGYVIDGDIDIFSGKEYNSIKDGNIVFFLIKDGVVVETIPATLSGRTGNRLTYRREFVTDVDFDSIVVGKCTFMYRM